LSAAAGPFLSVERGGRAVSPARRPAREVAADQHLDEVRHGTHGAHARGRVVNVGGLVEAGEHLRQINEAPWLVNGGHGASLRHHSWRAPATAWPAVGRPHLGSRPPNPHTRCTCAHHTRTAPDSRSVPISANQCRSVPISANQCRSVPISANQCQSARRRAPRPQALGIGDGSCADMTAQRGRCHR
jgi:hypothetical protein